MNRKFLTIALSLLFALPATAQEQTPAVTVDMAGTVRTKFEYQPTEGNARFSVRNVRFGVGGEVYSRLRYVMEVDFYDQGEMKLINAHIGGNLYRGLSFTLGYMRVPFSVDAHRSPHARLFANRSFVAKYVGNVRDVGALLGWKFGEKVPFNIQAGVFNGSGLPQDLQTYWTRSFNYSAKVQAGVAEGVNLVAGYHTTKPQNVRMHMYDAGATYTRGRWLVEGEYLRKVYSDGAFEVVNAVDAFLRYSIPTKRGPFKRIAFLGRYDYLDDHSNGTATAGGALVVNDHARHRATAGVTFSLALPFMADIRLNYENYFYRTGAVPGLSDHDKIVIEFMAHF
jgi:hypothetical protein